MPTLGLDYAGGRPGGAAIKAAGYGFVLRYLSSGGTGLPGKLLTAEEYTDLTANGISVAVNWETTADRMLSGFSGGVADAQTAAQVALTVGHPVSKPIYFSADFDATVGEQQAIDDYLRGAASVITAARVGIYGSYYVCGRCLDNGTAQWAWQAAAWSGGQVESRANLYQRIGTVTVGGVECDVNEAIRRDFGQHPNVGKDHKTMIQIPATTPPSDPESPPATWPQRNWNIWFDPAGGWEGDAAITFGVQDILPRKTDATRGRLGIASWVAQDGSLTPVDPVFTVKGGGKPVDRHGPLGPFVAPDGAIGITLNYSAPGAPGEQTAGVAIGRTG